MPSGYESTPSPTSAPLPNSDRPYESIVVGTDFTQCSAVAMRQALRISEWFKAQGTRASIHVVHVIDTVVVIELETALSPLQQSIRDGLVRDAQKAWAEFAVQIPGAEHVPIDVVINNRIAGILNHARQHKADLMVMGAFGDNRPDIGFGTVATACVRKSTSDVLLVRDAQSGPFKAVVAAVDFSETSALALARAAMVAAQEGAQLHVLHVYRAPWQSLHYSPRAPLVHLQQQQQYRESLEMRLADFAVPIAGVHKNLRVGTVCHDYTGHRSGIVDYARSVGADLLVLGTRGRTNIRDILLGSTAEKALAESPCSVLAVKPKGFHHPLATDESSHSTQPHGLRPQF